MRKQNLILRIACDTVLVVSLFYLPWLVTAALAFFCLLYFSRFYEIIVIGALADMVYGIPRNIFWNAEYVNTVFATLAYFGASRLKRFLIRESVVFMK